VGLVFFDKYFFFFYYELEMVAVLQGFQGFLQGLFAEGAGEDFFFEVIVFHEVEFYVVLGLHLLRYGGEWFLVEDQFAVHPGYFRDEAAGLFCVQGFKSI
jgi:hypothetical protein